MRISSKKVILTFALIIGICTLIISINIIFLSNDNVIGTKGTVIYLDLEGGFFGIIGDDGNHYDPINLPKDYEMDGLRVLFRALKRNDLDSIHMWGTIIQILNIQLV